MKADHQSFRKATSVSLLGLTLQLLAGLVVLGYSVLMVDPAAFSAALFLLVGSVVWLTLAVVFDQHRRERLEALEARTIESSGLAGSSVFEASDELRVAARRLAWMHRVLLPVVSLALAGIFIFLGFWRIRHAIRSLNILNVDNLPANRGMIIAIGIGLAVVGFVFARYVSGMAKQKAWAPLRAGAAMTVGGAIIGFAMVLGQFVWYAGPDIVFRYTHLIFPGLMILVGAEFILNFVLLMYRPRKAGEIPPPAFESRILGFVAAPDKIAESIGEAINYQLGINVTGSWFYQLLSRSLVMLIAIGGLVIWIMTCFAVVKPNEQALRLRNGQLVGEILRPGLVVKFPWPFERIERQDVSSPHRLELAGMPALEKNKSYLWTVKHHAEEKNFIVRPSGITLGAEAPLPGISPSAPADSASPGSVAADVMLLSVEIPVVFEIADLKQYKLLAQDGMQDKLLEAAGRRIVMRYLATQRIQDVLASGRTRISETLKKDVQDEYNRMNAGVNVLFVGIVGVHPPQRTAESFEKVVGADQQKQGSILKAQEEESTMLSEVAGSIELAGKIAAEIDVLETMKQRGADASGLEVQSLKIDSLLEQADGKASIAIAEAKADRWIKHMGARAQVSRYKSQLAALAAGKNVYLSQLYFDTLRDVLGVARVYITPDQSVPAEFRLDLLEQMDKSNVLSQPSESDSK
ncbi:MAG: SPFH domain-containing protein [Phycisphaerales bacterium]